jgi:O-antigen/teichoic acid export membrane protein
VRTLFRQVLVYGSGRLALQLVSFVTLPIMTRIFTPADYGVIEATSTLLSVIGIIASLSLESGAQRSYFDYAADQVRERRVVLSSAFWPMVSWAALLALTVVLLRDQLSQLLFGDDRYATVIAIAVAGFPIAVASTFFLEVMRLRQQPTRYVIVSWFGALSSVVLILYLVAIQDHGLQGFYLAGLLTAVPTLIAAAAVARNSVLFTIDRRELFRMLAYALPLVPVLATNWALQFLDRFFLLHFASLRELGLYALGVRLSNVLLFAVTAFAVAWSPFILDLYNRAPEEEPRFRARALTGVALALGFGAVCLSVYAREFFLTVTNPDFADAYKMVGILCLGIFCLGINAVTMTGISIARRTRYFAQYAVYTTIVNVVLNFVLIPPLEGIGAALATSLTFVVLAVLYYRRAQIVDPAPFELGRVLRIAVLAGAIIAVGTFVNLEPLWLSALVKVPLVLAFPLGAWVFGCVDADTRRLVRVFLPAIGRSRPASS